jgi:hypothetical protein
MKCPFQSSMVPPCKIEAHPRREDVEYCKVCGEWRHLNEVGDDFGDFSNVVWFLVSIAIVVMLMAGLMRQDPLLREDNYRRRQNYIGQRSSASVFHGQTNRKLSPTGNGID